jgi:hypothetical protein
MVGEYLTRAKVQEVEREIAQMQLASAAKRAQHRAGAVPKPRTVSAMPLRLLRRAYRQAGALRPAA